MAVDQSSTHSTPPATPRQKAVPYGPEEASLFDILPDARKTSRHTKLILLDLDNTLIPTTWIMTQWRTLQETMDPIDAVHVIRRELISSGLFELLDRLLASLKRPPLESWPAAMRNPYENISQANGDCSRFPSDSSSHKGHAAAGEDYEDAEMMSSSVNQSSDGHSGRSSSSTTSSSNSTNQPSTMGTVTTTTGGDEGPEDEDADHSLASVEYDGADGDFRGRCKPDSDDITSGRVTNCNGHVPSRAFNNKNTGGDDLLDTSCKFDGASDVDDDTIDDAGDDSDHEDDIDDDEYSSPLSQECTQQSPEDDSDAFFANGPSPVNTRRNCIQAEDDQVAPKKLHHQVVIVTNAGLKTVENFYLRFCIPELRVVCEREKIEIRSTEHLGGRLGPVPSPLAEEAFREFYTAMKFHEFDYVAQRHFAQGHRQLLHCLFKRSKMRAHHIAHAARAGRLLLVCNRQNSRKTAWQESLKSPSTDKPVAEESPTPRMLSAAHGDTSPSAKPKKTEACHCVNCAYPMLDEARIRCDIISAGDQACEITAACRISRTFKQQIKRAKLLYISDPEDPRFIRQTPQRFVEQLEEVRQELLTLLFENTELLDEERAPQWQGRGQFVTVAIASPHRFAVAPPECLRSRLNYDFSRKVESYKKKAEQKLHKLRKEAHKVAKQATEMAQPPKPM
eukprot:GHVT01074248.1.p1 GENE.GHVT01074248.1~~GHVT01074248.1.p1  ORF type:complete len:783 (+),score=127.90 GHVT01074248.1:319-2349(+)